MRGVNAAQVGGDIGLCSDDQRPCSAISRSERRALPNVNPARGCVPGDGVGGRWRPAGATAKSLAQAGRSAATVTILS